MRLLTNPIFVRMAGVFLLSGAAFVLGMVVIRWLRRRMVGQDPLPLGGEQAVSFHTYAVIQQLKQQKFALQNEQRIQSRRAKTSEHITSAVMSHVPCGVMFINPNGIIRQANTAARQILGFRSPLGMSVGELFRHARSSSESGAQLSLAEAFIQAVGNRVSLGPIDSRYRTPAGEERALKLTFVPIQAPSGDELGAAAVFSDETAVAALREAEFLREEASAEMVLELRSSLRSIRQWAAAMVGSAAEDGQNPAADIAAEAERLDRCLSRFVRGDKGALAAGV
jgi:PAS domain S-box-containing protein